MISKIERRNKIKTRIRGRISGTAQRPRMTVFRSNKQIYVQLIDDMAGTTLASASSRGLELKANKTEIAAARGRSHRSKSTRGRNRRSSVRPQRLPLPRSCEIPR